MKNHAAVAAGHPLTAKAAEDILRAGGNAADAIIAAFAVACVAEPVLASLGGGGFLLYQPQQSNPRLLDFFAQTPLDCEHISEGSFYPIDVDFGSAVQEFHIGHGSVATPGAVKGLFEIHRRYARMPMPDLFTPAIEAARTGIRTTSLQAYIFSLVAPIFTHSESILALYGSRTHPGQTLQKTEITRYERMANTLESLATEGEALFYQGEIARKIAALKKQGGSLGLDDLAAYEVQWRQPLAIDYGGYRFFSNPAPSAGGLLIAFAISLLNRFDLGVDGFRKGNHLLKLVEVLDASHEARLRHEDGEQDLQRSYRDSSLMQDYAMQVKKRLLCTRGTTHISIVDKQGNAAAMTVSNGEGCGFTLDDTGIVLNNMLGEEDLNPRGFFQWQANQRIASMMAPSLLQRNDGRRIVTGSGGSNRIRSAILQVLQNVVEFSDDIETAVLKPRIHVQGERIEIEEQLQPDQAGILSAPGRPCNIWPERHFFFGGAHSIDVSPRHLSAVGDPRRGGVSQIFT